MQLSVRKIAITGCAFLLAVAVVATHAEPISTIHSSVRALGMGEAFTAMADDSSSLFYNPAGLARVRGINWKVFSLRAGANSLETYTKFGNLQTSSGGSSYADSLNELMGEHGGGSIGGETIFTAPMIGFGIYNHADTLIQIQNPVYPELDTNVINDFGYILGFGIPVLPVFHIGMDLRYVKRTGAVHPFGASMIADLDSNTIFDNLTTSASGYGVDFGANFVIPSPLVSATLGAAWKNVGRTTYKSDEATPYIPNDDNDITLGAAVHFDTPVISVSPAVDFRFLNRSDLQLTRKINFGIEIDLPIIDIRGGFREGYYTGGFGVDLGLFRVDAATYGVELGAYPGQIEDRRYAVEFSMELGFGSFSATGGSSGGSSGSVGGGSSGGGGSSSSKSFWGGGRKLKRRR